VGKDDYRRQLVANQSGRCVSAYLYCAAGYGESTTDLAWDGHGMIYENGTRVTETERFVYKSHLATGDIDLDRIAQDRMRTNSFGQSVARHADVVSTFRSIGFSLAMPQDTQLLLERSYERFPTCPPIRPRAMSAATKCTRSRCRVW
jgi:NAD+ synthase (glutamine-hydrolysing)